MKHFPLILTALWLTLSCVNERVEPSLPETRRNILFYIATDEGSIIDGDTKPKIDDIRRGWQPGKGEMLIYADRLNNGATLMRISDVKGSNGAYMIDTLANYGVENSADPATLSRAIDSLTRHHKADSYGLIFFSHASGWLPKGMLANPRSLVIDKGGDGVKKEMNYTDFADAIPDHTFDFIILEACLMADVISMYELRNKADYILASSAEIVAPGFQLGLTWDNVLPPSAYQTKTMSLFDTQQPVETILKDFGQAYYNIVSKISAGNDYNSMTLGLIKMSEMDALATATKTALNGAVIHENSLKTGVDINDIQTFDRPQASGMGGMPYSRYFDFAHTLQNIVPQDKYADFSKQMEKTVVWKVSTPNFMLSYNGFEIKHHCGLTTYIERETVYPDITAAYEQSAWFAATQN
ncbi:MAG: hypothetical protein LBD53_08910 [Tannerella sp.]|jgi:hypothetical protein|nr:hypothetical protein [Tannerella sp.]